VKLKENRFLVLYGPTGVGKTDIALKISERLPCEIVNMDMGQCYTPLTIGTAKPDWRSMKVVHHLFDIVDEPKNITVVQYREACLQIMHQIWERGNLPILVGGSGFYLQSILFPPTIAAQEQEEDLKNTHGNRDDNALWQELNAIDPQRACSIHPNDTYRLKRALHIWYSSGKKPSEYKPTYDPPCVYDIYCLTRDRQELYTRIDERVIAMIKDGWINETKKLLNSPWHYFLQSKKIIGYSDIIDYLSGDQSEPSKAAMIRIVQQKTRNYAKRQMTFWRKLEKDLKHEQKMHEKKSAQHCSVQGINLTLLDVDLYINQLLKKVDTWFA
jgi:tRNA dimethylallyltransferase